jgi:hypothetical protein
MLRVPEADTGPVFNTPTLSAATMAHSYEKVERALGFPHEPQREPWSGNEGISATQALVLPSSTKHMFAARLAPRLDQITSRFDAHIDSLDCSDGTLHAIGLRAADGSTETLRAKQWVVCMGVVDSNLFAQRFSRELFGAPPPALGRYLHDHVSVPLFQVTAKRGGDFLRTFPPSFIGGFLGVRRFAFDFDNVPLYADLKRVLALRQARAGASAMIGAGLSLLRHGPGLMQIGANRFLGKRLHVPPDVPVTAVLDFETFPHVDNRIVLEQASGPARAGMHWNLRKEDFDAFARLVPLADRLMGTLASTHGFEAIEKYKRTPASLEAHLNLFGKDILHLGGGLAPARESSRAVLAQSHAFPLASNASVISTAVMARASVVNPTHTLLGLAERMASHLVVE